MNTTDLVQHASQKRWGAERAWAWHESLPWLAGCNFVPSCAVNQLEMWQAETFAPEIIDRELGWLAALGMNSMRVFLHDILWKQDRAGFLARMEQYLEIADKHGIGTMFVIFDSCWNPEPKAGPQQGPTPGVHNSYWVQSPGRAIVEDAAAFDRLEDYVTGVVEHFRDDKRVHAWDVWNEPDNFYMGVDAAGNKPIAQIRELILPRLARAFDWVRAGKPTQPATSGIWVGDWTDDATLDPFFKFQLLASDVVSFHRYLPPEETRASIETLKRFGRPMLCTEYVARRDGSTFQAILPVFKEEKIAAYNWGAVAGKTQTYYHWDSWQKPYVGEPPEWHHDVLRPDGTPYDAAETELIKKLTSRADK